METGRQGRRSIGPLRAGGTHDPRRAGNGQGGRVLIVDDDAAVRLVCAVNLTVQGLHVREAEDGLAAFEQARSERPDPVLADVKMPGLDGFQLAERLRRDERTCRIPLIVLSGEVERANVERARALGALAYLTKPFDPLEHGSFIARELVTVPAVSAAVAI